MAMRDFISILFEVPRRSKCIQTELIEFHNQHNHRIHWHWLSHAGLCTIAVSKRQYTEALKQGWLCGAVIPVHVRNTVRSVIRDGVQSPA